MSEYEDDQSTVNPYFEIIDSNVPKEKPPNWRSIVLFSGRLNPNELPTNWEKPQCNDGSLTPEARLIVKKLLNADGTLRENKNSTYTMEHPVI